MNGGVVEFFGLESLQLQARAFRAGNDAQRRPLRFRTPVSQAHQAIRSRIATEKDT
jgi:hypothetical protein